MGNGRINENHEQNSNRIPTDINILTLPEGNAVRQVSNRGLG